MKIDLLIGLQWGDEGKGKIVDLLCENYDIIARFQGGPNAGHTLEFDGIKHVLHTIPSGVFRKNSTNIIGNGVVIDPVIFKEEIDTLNNFNLNLEDRLFISRKAHLILPTHRLLDAASESSKGKSKIGSTLKGIGPAYMDKTGRNGLRVGDLEFENFKEKYQALTRKHLSMLKNYDVDMVFDLETMEQHWLEAIETLRKFTFIDSEHYFSKKLTENKKILAEGAQGSLLDVDFGTYPFVTSSNTMSAGACTGLGVAPQKIGKVFGVLKAYTTRVGKGPFPTEIFDYLGEKICLNGKEYGSTTGRKRRCGWLDIPALKYACMLNGVDELILMKADVLSGIEEIKVCTHYTYRGEKIDFFPYNVESENVSPIYKSFPVWEDNISAVKKFEDLPKEFKDYIKYIEKELGLPIKIISLGPDRSQSIII